jgi:hypothetical protein
VPIVLGGVLTYFKLWLPSEDDIRERSNLKRQILLEEVNKRLQQLLTRLQSGDFDLKDLRGAPPGQPDLISDYTAEFEQATTIIKNLYKIHACIKTCYSLLLVTVAVGLGGLLVALLATTARPYVSIVCYLAITTQLVVVFLVRRWTGRFEECEAMQ